MAPDTRKTVLEYARLALEEKLNYEDLSAPGTLSRKERMSQILVELGATHEEILAQAHNLLDPVE